MTRKDYELLAAALKESAPDWNDEHWAGYVSGWAEHRAMQWHSTVSSVTDALAGDNPRFDRRLFKLACGTAPKLAG